MADNDTTDDDALDDARRRLEERRVELGEGMVASAKRLRAAIHWALCAEKAILEQPQVTAGMVSESLAKLLKLQEFLLDLQRQLNQAIELDVLGVGSEMPLGRLLPDEGGPLES